MISPSLRSFSQTRMPLHNEHVGRRWFDLGTKVVVRIDDFLSDLAVAGSD